MSLSTNAGQIMRSMLARKEAVTRELDAAAKTAARELNTEARRTMNREIYSVPIPFKAGTSEAVQRRLAKVAGRGKHGMWKRTGKLLQAEKAFPKGAWVYLINQSGHGLARHNLGLPGHRQPKSPGVRSVQWQSQAVARKRAFVLQVRRQAVLRALFRR